MSFEPEIDEDLFDEAILAADEECDCGGDCLCEGRAGGFQYFA